MLVAMRRLVYVCARVFLSQRTHIEQAYIMERAQQKMILTSWDLKIRGEQEVRKKRHNTISVDSRLPLENEER